MSRPDQGPVCGIFTSSSKPGRMTAARELPTFIRLANDSNYAEPAPPVGEVA